MPRTSSAAAVPTTSTMVSCPPTSWKWICSTGRRWRRGLDLGQRRRRCRAPGPPPGRAGGPPRPAPRCASRCAPPRCRAPSRRHGWRRSRLAARARASRSHPLIGSRSQQGHAPRRSRRRRRAGCRAPCRRRPRRSSGTRRRCEVRSRRRVLMAVRSDPAAHGHMRATAHAAPNPLSMPTTVIPAAHDACIARSAVTPSRAEP